MIGLESIAARAFGSARRRERGTRVWTASAKHCHVASLFSYLGAREALSQLFQPKGLRKTDDCRIALLRRFEPRAVRRHQEDGYAPVLGHAHQLFPARWSGQPEIDDCKRNRASAHERKRALAVTGANRREPEFDED